MDFDMKKVTILFSILALNGCVTRDTPPSENTLKEHTLEVKYYTAINELPLPLIPTNSEMFTYDIKLRPNKYDSTSHLSLYSQDYAVKCNADKTLCKHSNIKPTLDYKVVKNNDGGLTIEGEFVSEAGREVEYKDDIGYIKRSVHADVPIWVEKTSKLPFSLSTTGKKYVELAAPTGNKLILKIK